MPLPHRTRPVVTSLAKIRGDGVRVYNVYAVEGAWLGTVEQGSATYGTELFIAFDDQHDEVAGCTTLRDAAEALYDDLIESEYEDDDLDHVAVGPQAFRPKRSVTKPMVFAIPPRFRARIR